jgi:hypothetical protein
MLAAQRGLKMKDHRTNASPSVRRRYIQWALLAMLLWWLAPAGGAHAGIQPPQVLPPQPTESDPVRVHVDGDYYDGCWYLIRSWCGFVPADTIAIEVFSGDRWTPESSMCPMNCPKFHFTCDYGMLPAGHYTVRVTEYRGSLRDPGTEVETAEFDVVRDTAVLPTSWGRVRSLYREKRE